MFRRSFLLAAVAFSILSTGPVRGDDPPAAAFEKAQREEVDDRLKRLSADVESLISANSAAQKKISELATQIKNVSEEQGKGSGTVVTPDDLKKLNDRITEVDKRREVDSNKIEKILDQLEKIAKALAVSKPVSASPVVTTDKKPESIDVIGSHTVQNGESLSVILVQANKMFKEKGKGLITMQQLVDANPGINPNKVLVGKKINIPAPPSP